MGTLEDMQLLSSCSRVLTSYIYHNGYCECMRSQRYHYGTFAVHKLPCVAPKFRLRRVQKKWIKIAKMKHRVLQKTLFYFRVFTIWKWFCEVIQVEKMVWRRCARQKNLLTFCRQLRSQFWKFPRIH